jgi:hypothetical protein
MQMGNINSGLKKQQNNKAEVYDKLNVFLQLRHRIVPKIQFTVCIPRNETVGLLKFLQSCL